MLLLCKYFRKTKWEVKLYMKANIKNGMSLMVLAIAIVVIIILAGMIILMLTDEDLILQAGKTAFVNDVKFFATQLEVYKSEQLPNGHGRFNPKSLQADESSVTYLSVVDNSKTINNLIPALGKATKYDGQFEVVDGELVFVGTDSKYKGWAGEAGIDVADKGEPKITFIAPEQTTVASGTDIAYTVVFTSNVAISEINLTGKVEILDDGGVALSTQPDISIGTPSGTSTDCVRQVVVTITTDNLSEGRYKLKIKAGAATNINNFTNSKDVISSRSFFIDNTGKDIIPPESPVLVASLTSWTNTNVSVTITYSEDTDIKEYSLDGITWLTYTVAVPVTTNNTTVYARATDAAGNQSGINSLIVSNIDKVMPVVSYGTNGESNVQTASTSVTLSDSGGSDINTSTLQYVWDTQNVAEPSSGWASFINSQIITKTSVTGTYYLWVKGADNAGNIVTEKSNAFVIDNTVPTNPTLVANPTSWTNESVTVTITYSEDTTVKEFSSDGISWSTYAEAIPVRTNNTTVYARGKDAAGNQSGQASLTVANIDNVPPTVAYGTNGASNVQTASTVVTVSDTGGSSINSSTLQYVWSTESVIVPASGWATFTNGQAITKTSVTGTYYLWIKASDNAGNSSISKTNAFVIDNTAPTNPTMSASPTSLTNGNVLVTITYSGDTTIKEYSLNGTTWNTYTSAITVTSNGTVYARGKDAVGNQSGQASLTVANIDKTAPTAPTIQSTPINGTSAGSQNVVFYESTSQSQSQVVTISNLNSVTSSTINTGSVSTSVSGNNVTVYASNGTSTRSVWDSYKYSSYASDYLTGSSDSFPSSISYSSGSYSGTLSKSGSAYVSSGSYTPEDSKSISGYNPGTSTTWDTYKYNGYGWGLYDTYAGNVPNTISYNSDGYSGTLSKNWWSTGHNDTPPSNPQVGDTYNAYSYWGYDYYGTVTRPGSDTRVYRQDYSGLVYAGGYTYYYSYTATLNYLVGSTTTARVTINYPGDATTKQYSVNGGSTWNNYTTALTVSLGTTVYSRCYDAAGNVSTTVSKVAN
jgi:hypothetical protein